MKSKKQCRRHRNKSNKFRGKMINGGYPSTLHWTCQRDYEDVDKVISLLDGGADVHARYRGRTPLHEACLQGHINVIKILLDNGADIEANDNNEIKPLHYAVYARNKDVIITLLNRGANVDCRDNQGNTPLHYVCGFYRFPVPGQVDMAQILVNGGADINAENVYNDTPLHVSARNKKDFMVEYLVNEGADVRVRDDMNLTPLMIANIEGDVKSVKHLIGHDGKTVEQRNMECRLGGKRKTKKLKNKK